MNTTRNLIAAAIVAAFPLWAGAQTTGSEVQRDINQQQRIEQGLQSGQLTTREAAKLEKEESKVNRMESRALKDGTLTDAEKARINRAQSVVADFDTVIAQYGRECFRHLAGVFDRGSRHVEYDELDVLHEAPFARRDLPRISWNFTRRAMPGA